MGQRLGDGGHRLILQPQLFSCAGKIGMDGGGVLVSKSDNITLEQGEIAQVVNISGVKLILKKYQD